MSQMDTWFSKEDVLKDIGVVAGRYEEVEDDFIVRGERPPPPRRIEDDEMNIMFRSSSPSVDFAKGPDLEGISYMLQMVDEYEDNGAEESGTAPNEVVTISKLNPNVSEFIPKCNNVVSSESNNISSNIKVDPPNKNKDVNVCNKTKDCKEIDIDKRIDVATLKPEEITHITKKLRSEICHAPNKDNWQGKRKRNVAIAALLKLYSANSGTPSPTPTATSENNEKPILFTPQYFERCAANAPLEEVTAGKAEEAEDFVLENASTPLPVIEKGTNDILKVDTNSSNEPASSSSSIRSPDNEDPEIRQSIQKVNSWFEKPASPKKVISPKPKGPVLFLGPVSFKKKVIQKSSTSEDSKRSTPTNNTTNSSVSHVAEYKPSSFADDLSKMYSKRKEDLVRKELDIWARAEMEMKAREEKLKESALEKSKSANDSQDNSSNEAS